jgi:hypothetical protein
MARTSREVLVFFKILKSVNKKKKIRVGIDLGCGDGVALKYFSMFGLKSIGVEFDSELAKLASANNPNAEVILGDLTENGVIERTIEVVHSHTHSFGSELNLLVYAFNPMVPEIMIEVIRKYVTKTDFVLFLKNPTLRKKLQEDSFFQLETLHDDGNHLVQFVSLSKARNVYEK